MSRATQLACDYCLVGAQLFQAREVHRLLERIAQRLVDQRMVGDLARALDVVLARRGIGEHRLQQVLGVHALQLVRDARAAAVARHGERERRAPAPARLEDRRIEDAGDGPPCWISRWKALRAEHRGEVGVQHLERDRASCRISWARNTVAMPPRPSSRSSR